MRRQQNIVKTGARGTSELSRGEIEATRHRFEGAFDSARCTASARTAHWKGLAASPKRIGNTSGRLLAALGTPRASQDRLWVVMWASTTCPKRVWTRPRTTSGAPNSPRSIFRGFWIHFGLTFEGFFVRFSFEPPATKAQNRNLKKGSCDPHRTSWRLRCAVAACCVYVFRKNFRILRVQLFVLAYPQAHLVN